ncbi:C-type lectin-like [Trinorchestia longiramus]|nr:C-type lectin-like [Trinorchestia longiramus]
MTAITVVSAAIRGIEPRAWRLCNIQDQTTFDTESPNIKTKTVYVSMEILCSLLADMHVWVEFWCYSEDLCTMWGIEALVAGNTTFSSSGTCRKRFAQCDNIFSETSRRLLEGEGDFEPTCVDGYRYQCHPDGIQKINKTAITPIAACGEQDFFSTAVGCLKVETTEMTYSAARQNCINYGADLFHSSSPDALAQLPTILSDYSSITNMWYGLTKFGGGWTWLNGRELAPEETVPEAPFSGYPGELFGKGKPAQEFLVSDDVCFSEHPSLCIAKNVN